MPQPMQPIKTKRQIANGFAALRSFTLVAGKVGKYSTGTSREREEPASHRWLLVILVI